MPSKHANHSNSFKNNDLPFSSQVPFILFLTSIFLLNFMGRIILSPLMPAVEKDLGLGHGEAGSFFLMISFDYISFRGEIKCILIQQTTLLN